jgi:hypothetical protein
MDGLKELVAVEGRVGQQVGDQGKRAVSRW